jgi:hypothetical protein
MRGFEGAGAVEAGSPDASLAWQYLAYMMLVQALRLHLSEGVKGGVGKQRRNVTL